MTFSLRHPVTLLTLCLLLFPKCSCDQTAYIPTTPAFILLNPSEIDFGPIPLDSFASAKFTILNKGQRELNVSGFSLDPVDAPFATERSALTVAEESSVDIVIHFRPTQIGIFEANLTVQHDAENDDTPTTITLKGIGSEDVICTACGGKIAECEEDTLISYESVGGCEEDQCLYEATRTLCECGCDTEELLCNICEDAGPAATPFDAGNNIPLLSDAGSPSQEDNDIASESYRAVVAANIGRTCGITSNGQVKCWGKCDISPTCPSDGLWGNNIGETPASMEPMNLGFNTPVASIKWSGFSYCILTTNNYAKCWGSNLGPLGFPSTSTVVGEDPDEMGANLPYLDVGSDLTIQKLDLAFNHGCALLTNGRVKCWGAKSFLGLGYSGSLYDQLGDEPNEMGNYLPFVDLGSHGHAVVDIALAGEGSCALFDNGQVKCWGRNRGGMLGLGEGTEILGITNIRGDNDNEMGDDLPFVDLGTDVFATQITLGLAHACILTDDHRVKCWGANGDYGFLGHGNNEEGAGTSPEQMGDNLPYTDLGNVGTVIAIFSKGSHTCALFDIGKIKCWGDNWAGMLGYEDITPRGTTTSQMGENLPFVDLGEDFFVTGLTIGALTSCASNDTGNIKCWGQNSSGELGLGDDAVRGDGYGEMGDNLPEVQID